MAALRLSELLAGLSLTIDLAGGAPLEKGLRTCAVATAFADGLGLDLPDQRAAYHASLLMGIGCTAHAPENASMFEDDMAFAAALRVLEMALHAFEVRGLAAGADLVVADILIDVTLPSGGRMRDEELHLWRFDADGRICGMRQLRRHRQAHRRRERRGHDRSRLIDRGLDRAPPVPTTGIGRRHGASAYPVPSAMAHLFICPNCGNRTTESDRTAGFRRHAKGCSRCGFGFLFELLDDYYPAPDAAFFVCDQEGRVIGCGRGSFELTGLDDERVIGRHVSEVLGLRFSGGEDPVATVLEWGVRALAKPVEVNAEGDLPAQATADLFPAYDDDGGMLLVLTPAK